MTTMAKVLLTATVLIAGVVGLPELAHAAPPAADLAAAAAEEGAGIVSTFDPASPPQSGAQSALRILIMMTALSLLPALVMTMTSFARIVIVFSFLKQALGVQGMPPTQIIVGMS
ncbi:MAG: flagellar biosynthetic protein FliP, partial [Nannocystaceae bacterium]